MTDEWEDFTDPDLEEETPTTVNVGDKGFVGDRAVVVVPASEVACKITKLKIQVDKQEADLKRALPPEAHYVPEGAYYDGPPTDEPQEHEYHDLLNELGITISQPPDPASEQAEAWADFLTTRYLNADAEARRAAESAEARKKRLEREKAAILWVHGAWLDSYVRARMSGRAKSVYVGTALLGVEKDRQSGKLVILRADELGAWAEKEAPQLLDWTVTAKGGDAVWKLTKAPRSIIPDNAEMSIHLPAGEGFKNYEYVKEIMNREVTEGLDAFSFVTLDTATAYHKETKQVPPGCEWIPPQEKLYVRNPRK